MPFRMTRSRFAWMNACGGLLVLALSSMPLRPAAADGVVGRFSNDWTGNGLEIQAVEDPKVKG